MEGAGQCPMLVLTRLEKGVEGSRGNVARLHTQLGTLPSPATPHGTVHHPWTRTDMPTRETPGPCQSHLCPGLHQPLGARRTLAPRNEQRE